MLRNIVYRDKDIEITLVAIASHKSTSLSVQVYYGHAQGIRSLKAWFTSDFATRSMSPMLQWVLCACWEIVKDNGSVTDELMTSVNHQVDKEVGNAPNSQVRMREIDWTKQIPTELGAGGTDDPVV